MTVPRRTRRLVVPILLTWLWARSAGAHHAPGHGASEVVRAVSSLSGQSARASQRVMFLGELSRATDQPSGGSATNIVTSLIGSFMPHPWLSLGVQLPWVFVDEDASTELTTGYGDTTLEAIVTPHGNWLRHRIPSFGLRLSLPTRTFELAADPGKVYSASPFAAYTRKYAQLYWQAMLLTTVESRPAGWAWDLSGGGSLGYEFSSHFGVSLGGWVDSRLLAHCKSPSGDLSYCREGRVTELERPTGATRVYVVSNAFYELGAVRAVAGLQLPLTSRRDFSVAGQLGVQVFF